MSRIVRTTALVMPLVIAACAAPMQAPDAPQAVTPPAGAKYSMTAVGIGEITYECRPKASAADAFEWVFVAPVGDAL